MLVSAQSSIFYALCWHLPEGVLSRIVYKERGHISAVLGIAQHDHTACLTEVMQTNSQCDINSITSVRFERVSRFLSHTHTHTHTHTQAAVQHL